jgi:hypothetical protein
MLKLNFNKRAKKINRFLIERMGQMDENLLSDICIGIFEQINIVPDNK